MRTALRLVVAGCFLGLASQVFASEPAKIAFVDTGNTGRSLTAEAIASQIISAKTLHVAVISRAVDMDPFDVSPETNAAVILKKNGMDVGAHRAAQLTVNDIHHADVILCMTAKHRDKVIAAFPEAKDKTFILAEYATGKATDVDDAYGKPMEVYEAMFAQVSGYVPAAIDKALASVKH